MQTKWTLRLVGPWREEQGGGGHKFLEKVKSEAKNEIQIWEPVFEQKDLIKQYQEARIFVYPSQGKDGGNFRTGRIGSDELWMCALGFLSRMLF